MGTQLPEKQSCCTLKHATTSCHLLNQATEFLSIDSIKGLNGGQLKAYRCITQNPPVLIM
jgi:hypothetical protein